MNYIEELDEIGKGEHSHITEIINESVSDYYKISGKYQKTISWIFNPKYEKHNKKIIPGGYHPKSIEERLGETSPTNHESIMTSSAP